MIEKLASPQTMPMKAISNRDPTAAEIPEIFAPYSKVPIKIIATIPARQLCILTADWSLPRIAAG